MATEDVTLRPTDDATGAGMPGQANGSGLLADRLASARLQYFFGRQEELSLFRRCLDGSPGAPSVIVLHGPGGMGKSALLQRFAMEASAAGRPVVAIDADAIDVSPSAFEQAAAGVFSQDDAVLLVDSFEHYRDLEEWIREGFLPRLPTGALVVLAGRFAPDPLWKADFAWSEVLHVLPLDELAPKDAADLLASQGVDPSSHGGILRGAAGSPLALRMAAEAVSQATTAESVAWALRVGTDRLLTKVVGKLPSAKHRRALETCSHVVDTTEELLRLVLPEEDAAELFDWLRQQSYVKSSPFGLRPYDIVRNAVDNDLRWRDPEGFMAMHHVLRRHFVERVRNAPEKEALRAAGEYTHIIAKVPWVKDFRGSREEAELREEPVRPEDGAALIEMTRATEGDDSARIVAHWLERRPEAFHVHRRCDNGEPLGFLVWLRIDALDDDIRAADPVVAQAWDSVSAMAPLRQGEHLGVARFMVHPQAPHRPSRSRDLAHTRIVYEVLRTKHCSWSTLVTGAPDSWSPFMTYLGMFQPLDAGRTDGQYGLFCHDWRAVGVAEWSEGIGARLLGECAGRTPETPGTDAPSLSRQESDAAVRDALRQWFTPGGHADNPLLQSRLVTEHSAGDPAAALRELLDQAVTRLDGNARTQHLHAVLTMTYKSMATQEAVARKLDMSYSTYRRYLARAIDEVRETMWRWQVRARIRAEQGLAVSNTSPATGDGRSVTARPLE
ncbi:AAA family ATPase [Streptomyces tendae]|uniref:AAA family ATPase n=1 Tax=Streptomyces tendae TaxID=1932 RepID=UPI0037AEF865